MGRKTKMNSITSEPLLREVNVDNAELRADFMNYLRATRKSEGTVKQYGADLNIFFVWVLQNAKNKRFQDITKRDIIAFQNWLLYENENSPARVRRIKATISSLSNYCENILADDDPNFSGYHSIVKKIENPPLYAAREKTVWDDAELEALLDKLTEMEKYEMACFVALGMYSGRRKSELLRFTVRDFSDDHLTCSGALYKSAPILTKGNKYLECYTLAKKFKPYFDNWMKYREDSGIKSEWLFPDCVNHNQQRSVSSLNSWTVTLSRITGRDFYFHSLRHFFVSALSRAGIPDNVVVQIIGWSSADMFNIYNDNSKDDQIAMYFADGDIAVPGKKGFSDL